MANPLFSMFGNQAQANNGMMGLIQQFMNFKRNFNGDPRQQVQQLLNGGKVSQADYDRAVQMARQLQNIMGR